MFVTNSAPMTLKSNEKSRRPIVNPTSEMKLEIIADSEAGK
jgi:hypothetical protein